MATAPEQRGASASAVSQAPATEIRSRWLVFTLVASALWMASLDTTIVSTALPEIHESLGATINWAGWTVTIYTLGMVVALPVAGKMSDLFGRRKIFFIGVAVFTISSLACGFAPNIYVLLIFRAIQALGSGTFTPSAAGIIADTFGKGRDRAIGMFGTIQASGQITGPVLGGVLVGYLSWRWVFFVNVPIGAILLLFVPKLIPESVRQPGGKVDLRGLSLMIGFVLVAMFGISDFGTGHTPLYSPTVVVPEIVALVLLGLFVNHTRTDPASFIPRRLLVGRGFGIMNVENLLWGVVGYGVAALVPLYARDRYHFDALNSGTLLTARAIGMIAIGGLATFALRRTGFRLPLIVGYSLVAFGVMVMSISPRFGISAYAWLSIGACFTGLGNGSVNPALRNACLQLEPESVTAITGLRVAIVYIGTILSVTIVTAFLNRSPNPGIVQAHVMWVVAGIIVLILYPLTMRVPEHKGSW